MADQQVVATPFKVGDIIKQSYTLTREVGAGAYGAIFEARYQGSQGTKNVALKFEKEDMDRPLLLNEVMVMKAMAGNKHYAKFYQYGSHKDYKFVAMELLGPCLIDLVNRKPPFKFTLFSVLKFGLHGLKGLEAMHEAGFVHRDVKPGNFVIGNTKESAGVFFVIDFGLCKKLPPKDKRNVIPPHNGNFRGTLRYASLNAHYCRELGQADDLMSLLYIMVEFYMGKLPWTHVKTREEVQTVKEQCIGERLVAHMPHLFLDFEMHIQKLQYFDE
ncbi:MAG: putative Tau-tubulin kinase 1, partial [Streblomastix strix]